MEAKTTKVMVTGANGQLGSRLMACALNRHDVVLEGLTQGDLDVCDREAVGKRMALLRPDVVIHCAAYTAVDAQSPTRKRRTASMPRLWRMWPRPAWRKAHP